jgi:uncharacterized membrane protein YbhN (UPF0104 family)
MSDDRAVQSPSRVVHGAARHRTVAAGRAARRDLGKKLLKLIGYLVVGYLILRLIPSLERAIGSLERVRWQWLVVAFALEVASEMGFVVAWHAIVDPEDQLGGEGRGERTDTRIAWLQLGGGMFIPGGSLSSVGVGASILHHLGMPNRLIAERQFNLQFLNTAIDALALAVFGAALASGIFPGERKLTLTLLPAAVAAISISCVLWIATKGSRYAASAETKHPKIASAVGALSDAVQDTRRLLTHREGLRSTLGAIVYLGFDVLVLWSAFIAIGTHPRPDFGVVIMAYIIGALGGSLPLPAGLGSVAGMVGMLILYGVPHTDAVLAVVLYQAIGQLVPLAGGAIAYALLRTTAAFRPPAYGASSETAEG